MQKATLYHPILSRAWVDMMSTSCNCSYVLLGEKILLDVKVWLDELDLEAVIAESLKEFGDVDKLRNTQAPLCWY